MQRDPNTHLQKAHTLFAQAKTAQSKEKFSEAIKNYEQVLTLVPTYTLAHLGKAECHWQQAREAKAAKSSFGGLARMFRDTDDKKYINLAIASATKAVELDRDLVSAHVLLGVLFGSKKTYIKAHQHFELALQLNPSENIYAKRGRVYYYERRLMEALADFQKAIELVPSDIQSWLKLADIYKRQNQKLEAMECLAAASRLDPTKQAVLVDYFVLFHEQPKDKIIEFINHLPNKRAALFVEYIHKNFYIGNLSAAMMDLPIKHDFGLSSDDVKTLYDNKVRDYLSIAKLARGMVVAGYTKSKPRIFFEGERGLRVKLVAAAAKHLPEQEAMEEAEKQLSMYENKVQYKMK